MRLYQLTLFLALVSLALNLVTSGRQREFFYVAIYFSMAGLFVERKNITLRPFSIALPILLLGILNLVWYFVYEYHSEGVNIYNEYLMSSKKMILGSILIFYLDRFKKYVSIQSFEKYFLLASGVGFFLASFYALWQVYHGIGRVEMGINRATVSAYIYSVLSLSFIYSLFLQKKIAAYVLAGALMLFSWGIIILTGTRAAMGLFLIFSASLTLYHFRKFHIKPAIIFLCSTAMLFAVSYSSYIKPKIDQTVAEVNNFQQGKDNTSLGARFSMWAVGLENGIAHPLGQSMESREQWTGKYIKNHPDFSSSMTYINVHLHNEFIERFSLQGIFGMVLSIFVFASLLQQAYIQKNTTLLLSSSSLLLYGMTDVILLSSEALVFFIIIFALSTVFYRNNAITKQ